MMKNINLTVFNAIASAYPYTFIKPSLANVPILLPLKTPEN